MDSTWIVAGAGVLGLSAWLYSKTTSPEISGDDDTGDSSLSDSKPRWGSRGRTNLEYLPTTAIYTTSCGWSPEEKYCPTAVLAERECSEECLRPYRQTAMNLMGQQQGSRSSWVGGTGGRSPDMGGYDPRDAFCFQGQPIAKPLNGEAIRARVVYPKTIETGNWTTFDIEVQIFKCVKGCGVSALYSETRYGWRALPAWTQNALVISDVRLMDAQTYSVARTYDESDGGYFDNGISLLSVTNTGDVTRYRFRADNNKLGRGAVSLSATVDFNRIFKDDDLFGDADDACEFSSRLDISIANFFFVDASDECGSGCPAWADPDNRLGIIECSNQCNAVNVDIPDWITDTWRSQSKDAKYDTYAGDPAVNESAVLNAETIFPRNGFAVF